MSARVNWPEHYCRRRHDPRVQCPATPIEFGGVPATELPRCTCEPDAIDHAPECRRALAIVNLMTNRRR